MSLVTQFIQEAKDMGLDKEETKEYVIKRQIEESNREAEAREERRIQREIAREEREQEAARLELERQKVEQAEAHREFVRSEREAAQAHELELLRLKQASDTNSDGSSSNSSASQVSFEIPKLKLPSYKEGERIEPYIARFEEMAKVYQLSESSKKMQFYSLFDGKALDILHGIYNDSSTFETMKAALLKAYGLTVEDTKLQFHRARLQEKETATQFLDRLKTYLDQWMEKDETPNTREGVIDLILRNQLEKSWPSDLVAQLKLNKVKTASETVEKADAYFTAYPYKPKLPWTKDNSKSGKPSPSEHQLNPVQKNGSGNKPQKKDQGQNTNQSDWKQKQKQYSSQQQQQYKPQYKASKPYYQQSGPPAYRKQEGNAAYIPQQHTSPSQVICNPPPQMVSNPQQGMTINPHSSVPPSTSYSAVCVQSQVAGASTDTVNGTFLVQPGSVGGIPVDVLRDNGSSGCSVRQSLVRPEEYTGRQIHVRMIDGSVRMFPEALIQVTSPFFTGSTVAVVMPEPLFDLIVGNISGVRNACTVDVATQTSAAVVTRAMARAPKPVTPLTIASPQDLINSQDVVHEQQSDPTLAAVRKKLEGNVVIHSRVGQCRFLCKRGRLYRETKTPQGEVRLQFIVPAKYRRAVFDLGHCEILGGHMGQKKTFDRIQAVFFWPGMGQEINRLVRSCDVCQRTTDKGRVPPAPLQPMPVISEPFERVAVDIVGPIIPRASDGSKYILTIVDFSTRWPEAVALRNIEAVTVAEAMVEVFCRVGIPKEVLSDRGSQFTSTMMSEFYRLMNVRGLQTTPYHPMCNGLCERFNGTLKKMLKRMAVEQPKEWPRFIAPLLFAYREAPQHSLKFSPFELVYGRTVRGPLQVLRELWDDEEPDPEVKATYTYVLDLADRLQSTCELAREELVKAKVVQKSYYDRKAKLRRLSPGDKCLVLLPTAHNKLLAQWKGPYEVVERVSDLNYVIQMGNLRKRFHINMLKEYLESDPADTVVDNDQVELGAAAVIPADDQDDEPLTVQSHQKEAVADVFVNVNLPVGDQDALRHVICRYADVFSDRPKIAKVECHKIELTSNTVVKVKPYPIPMRLQDAVDKEIADMETAGVIEKSSSPFCSPMVVVRKKDGGVRICGDYRRLNAITKVDSEPMSDHIAIFSKLAGSKYYTKLDLAKGFFQIPLHPECRQYTAFATPRGLYQYKVLPFGLTNSPAVFNRAMRQVLHGIEGVEMFVDDVLIHSATLEEHLRLLEVVFSRLHSFNMTVKPSKCKIAVTEVEFLGHIVGNNYCRCQDDKIRKIKEAPRPVTKKQVRAFLGLTNYYRNFIPHFAVIAQPLYDTVKKNAPSSIPWGNEQEKSFVTLKNMLCKEPILQLPDASKQFILRTDASQDGVGAVLMQESEGGIFPVAYHSRKLKAAEKNYSTVEKELLAVVDGIKKYYYYLFGAQFILETDHMPLTSIGTTKTANARLTRWALYLQQFNFLIKYIKGSDNVGADLMSRLLAD